MIIDAFAHFIPKETLDGLSSSQSSFASPLVKTLNRPEMSHVYDLEAHRSAMDRLGIDLAIVSVPQVVSGYVKGDEEVKVLTASNNAIAKAAEKSKGRLLAVANLPMTSPQKAADELRRAIETLGMKGVQLYSNVDGKPIDAPEFLPIFDIANHYGIPILLHPTDTVIHSWGKDFRLNQIFGWPFDTSLAMGRLAFGGVLDKYPNLKIIAHHSGAMVSFLSQRIQGFHEPTEFVRADSVIGETTLQKVPNFKKFYVDTAVYGAIPALMCAYAYFGVSHMLFGSDYPFGPKKGEKWAGDGLSSVKNMPVPAAEKELILEKNARALFKIG